MSLSNSASFRRQNLLIEFASLKYASPQGIYLSLSPQNPSLWWGVMFVRKGPYASAIFKFTILFPTSYPIHPPVITFLSGVFHPLVVPLASSQNDESQNTPDSSLPPRSFNLEHGFPEWCAPSPISRETSHPSDSVRGKRLPRSSHRGINSQLLGSKVSFKNERAAPLLSVLHYMKSTFADEKVLDDIPAHYAVNLAAWKARKGLSSINHSKLQDSSLATGSRMAWEDKVQACIEGSKSDGVLFGELGSGRPAGSEEMIRFLDVDDEAFNKIKEWIDQSTREGERLRSGNGNPGIGIVTP